MLAETAARAASQREIYQELMFTPTGKPFGDMLNADAVKAIKLTDDATAGDIHCDAAGADRRMAWRGRYKTPSGRPTRRRRFATRS